MSIEEEGGERKKMKEETKEKLRELGMDGEAIAEIEADEEMVQLSPERHAKLLRSEQIVRFMWDLFVQIKDEMGMKKEV